MEKLDRKAIEKIYIRVLKGGWKVKIDCGRWCLISPYEGSEYYYHKDREGVFERWLDCGYT